MTESEVAGLASDDEVDIARHDVRGPCLLGKLTQFYDQHGIHPLRFRCLSRASCSANSPDFTEAKASFVGPAYDDGGLPRLLFLSLDPGSASSDPAERTPKAVRRSELETDVTALDKRHHWYHTHELAHALLHQFKSDLSIPDTWRYFAHVNSAKCCQNKPGRRQADRRLFDNCRRFIPGELRVLDPDIVVTQGAAAADAIHGTLTVQQRDRRQVPSSRRVTVAGSHHEIDDSARYETGIIKPARREVLWLHTYHPRAWGYYYRQRRLCWPLYVEVVKRFWAGSK